MTTITKTDAVAALASVRSEPLTWTQIAEAMSVLCDCEPNVNVVKKLANRLAKRGMDFPANRPISKRTPGQPQLNSALRISTDRQQAAVVLLRQDDPALSYREITERLGETGNFVRLVAIMMRRAGETLPTRPRSNWAGVQWRKR